MSTSLRKFLGSFVLLFGIGAYIWLVLAVGTLLIPRHWFPELIFYAIAGVAWAFPTKHLIFWMGRGKSSDTNHSNEET